MRASVESIVALVLSLFKRPYTFKYKFFRKRYPSLAGSTASLLHGLLLHGDLFRSSLSATSLVEVLSTICSILASK